MLCNLNNNSRPDKALQHTLIKLSITLILLSLSILSFFMLPQYLLYDLGITIVLTITCFILTIKTLKSGEAAISYGGFANEIIRLSPFAERIENPDGESIIQNKTANDLLGTESALKFIQKYLAESSANKTSLDRLNNALNNLNSEKVIVSLLLNQQSTRIFNDLEYFEITLAPIYLKRPKIFNGAFSVKRIKRETYFHWTFQNITAQRGIDRILHNELNSLHDFLDQLPAGLYTTDANAQIAYVNSEFAEFLQTSTQQLIGQNLSDFIDENTPVPQNVDYWHSRVCFRKADNEMHDAYVFQTSYRQNEKTFFRGIVIHNIPSLNLNKENIASSLDNINTLLSNFPVGIIFTDKLGNIINSNTEADRLFKINKSKKSNLFDNLTADNIAVIRNAFSETEQTAKPSNIEIKQLPQFLSCYIHKIDTSNEDSGFLIYALDVTKQKNLEIQFTQAQKMQAIGQFAGGVAHDFNNLLTAIIGFTDLLLQRHGIGDPSFADLIQIKQNANRATSLVRQLLAFSRQQPLLPKLIDITENFADLSQMLKRIIGEKIKLVFHHGNDLGFVKVDPNQFAQVIVNLVVNAKDALNGSGTITISTHPYHLKDKYLFGGDTIPAGEFVKIDVTDDGCGIPPENLDRIFDPFFSTKENIIGSGTGLGLAMVYGIVRQTEGFIKVDSTVGQGTTFSIFLPRFDQDPGDDNSASASNEITDKSGQPILKVQETLSAPANINQKIIMGLNINKTIDRSHFNSSKTNQSTRILFIEDEAAVRIFAVRALKKQGYEVVAGDSAENALEILQNDKNFDLLFTDMVLPQMSGAQLINQVKKMLPDISVILASGYSEDIARQEIDNAYEFNFIAKPYSLGDLTAKVCEVLEQKNA